MQVEEITYLCVWLRIQKLQAIETNQKRLSKQGAMNVINPLLNAGLVIKVGTKKSGRYQLPGQA